MKQAYYKKFVFGELAQLARAPALHAGGHRFESVILHKCSLKLQKFFDILKENTIDDSDIIY